MLIPLEKPDPIPNEIIFAVHQVLRMGVLDCRQLLRNASPLFYARFLEAIGSQTVNREEGRIPFLHDPIEDLPEFAEALATVRQRVAAELEPEYRDRDSFGRRGSCHRFWRMQELLLREEYGIEWFSPARMNPHRLID